MPCHGSHADLARLGADIAELVVEVVDVDQVLEVGETQPHHRQEAVSPRYQARRASEPFEKADRLVDARRSFVVERCWNLHVLTPPGSRGAQYAPSPGEVNGQLRLCLGVPAWAKSGGQAGKD